MNSQSLTSIVGIQLNACTVVERVLAEQVYQMAYAPVGYMLLVIEGSNK